MPISKSQRGFSLTELLVTLAILMTGGAVAVMNISGAVRGSHVETAYQNTSNSCALHVRLPLISGPFAAWISPLPDSNGTQAFADGTPVQTETINLPTDVQYTIVAGMPTPPTPTPDNIGSGRIAIDFDQVKSGGGTTIFFSPTDLHWIPSAW